MAPTHKAEKTILISQPDLFCAGNDLRSHTLSRAVQSAGGLLNSGQLSSVIA
jgi:hypothetical protein